MTGLAELLGLAETVVAAWLLVFLRVGAAMALLPAFGEQTVPARIRLASRSASRPIVAPAAGPDIAAHARRRPGLRARGRGRDRGGPRARESRSAHGPCAPDRRHDRRQHDVAVASVGGAGVDPQPAMAQVLVLGGLALAALLDLHVKIAIALLRPTR
jgi:flagellar biosynthesis protein FliR